jgi:hypothetical protein
MKEIGMSPMAEISRSRRGPSGRRLVGSLRAVAAVAGLALAAAGVPGWLISPSAASAATPNDGSDWGPTGLSTSPSQAKVAWDNTGNPAADVVYRDGRQQLPHTDHKTYDDVASSVVSNYFDAYGPGNGLGGLKLTVSQTQDLVNQSINVQVSGVKGGQPFGLPTPVYLQVFQCWGGLTSSGAPDRGAAQPDPATCQVGAGDASVQSQFQVANSRFINADPLLAGSDWQKYLNKSPQTDVPFTSIAGVKSGSTNAFDNQFFNSSSSNEISRLQVSASGSATRQFEVQTAVESGGLGCGRRRGEVSTATCWLVVVPRVDGVLSEDGPITPSLWAQRMQVKLGFRDIVAGCPSGQDRTLTAGSELLTAAAASWTPGLCAAKNIALGYTQLGDPVARNEFDNGASDAVLTTQPGTKAAAYTPVALSAPVITYALSYQPQCPAKATAYTADQATACGYSSLAALNTDIARSGTLVRNLKLDARLVAKLLTQSYSLAIFENGGFHRSGWMVNLADGKTRPNSLAGDPEFFRLNPDLKHISVTASAVTNLDHLIVEALRSDAASQIWSWIQADPEASAFLDGCPDANGMTINPFYSNRSYAACEATSNTLSLQAAADIKATTTAGTYADLPLSYPPPGSPYPLTGWQEAHIGGEPTFGVFDFLPPVNSMPVAGRDVAIGYLPRNSNLCLTAIDSTCTPAPGKWSDPKTRQAGDQLGVMSITTAATAAQFQLPTASLCDTSGAHCVGASTSSFERAAAGFVSTETRGVVAPGPADYAAGAYPLTMPVYAAVQTALPSNEKAAYAHALQYITTTGQKPGFGPGNLPQGYAPLTKPLLAQANSAISALLTATPASKPTSTSTASGGSSSSGGSSTPGGVNAPSGPSAHGTTPVTNAVSPTELVTVSSGTPSWPKWPLPFGLAVAVLAGIAGPIMRLRGTVRIG